MTEETEALVLELLREVSGSSARTASDIADLKLRMSALEQHLGQIHLRMGSLNNRMDRFDGRLARVERRLELVEV
jgi:DNA-binding transcriptional ArsR family regulator